VNAEINYTLSKNFRNAKEALLIHIAELAVKAAEFEEVISVRNSDHRDRVVEAVSIALEKQ
jgi:hypothetical protein